MALRSMIRKIPALAAGLRAPPARAPSSALRPWSRFLSQGTGAAAGRHAVYSEEMLREEADRVHAEFLRDMKLIQQERDELWRMQHNRGQFTSSKPRPDEATSELTAPDGSPNWASVEGRPPSAAELGIFFVRRVHLKTNRIGSQSSMDLRKVHMNGLPLIICWEIWERRTRTHLVWLILAVDLSKWHMPSRRRMLKRLLNQQTVKIHM